MTEQPQIENKIYGKVYRANCDFGDGTEIRIRLVKAPKEIEKSKGGILLSLGKLEAFKNGEKINCRIFVSKKYLY